MEDGTRDGLSSPPASRSNQHIHMDSKNDIEEDEIAELDPDGRYYRYTEVVGRGRFKQIFKAFDTTMGIDVAWSKISADINHLDESQIVQIVEESRKGLVLEHPNIIRCFKCWEDNSNHCINLITELFTSGNLRQYRNLHKHLDLKAVKRMARQILKGLEYLHSMEPPVTHGDLRCDKIYVNGHTGEIKIGDLGLATLLPKRWENGEGSSPMLLSTAMPSDIFAFGLCMLELLTLEQLDPQHCEHWQEYLPHVPDEEARSFIAKCLGPPNERPSAEELLLDSFLNVKKPSPPVDAKADEGAGSDPSGVKVEKRKTEDDDTSAPISIGKLRGEDYIFEFHGKVKEGKMYFRLVMQHESDGESSTPLIRTIDFVYDPEVDTADNLANDLAEIFSLSTTDTEICAAALREWLAKEMPGSEGSK